MKRIYLIFYLGFWFSYFCQAQIVDAWIMVDSTKTEPYNDNYFDKFTSKQLNSYKDSLIVYTNKVLETHSTFLQLNLSADMGKTWYRVNAREKKRNKDFSISWYGLCVPSLDRIVISEDSSINRSTYNEQHAKIVVIGVNGDLIEELAFDSNTVISDIVMKDKLHGFCLLINNSTPYFNNPKANEILYTDDGWHSFSIMNIVIDTSEILVGVSKTTSGEILISSRDTVSQQIRILYKSMNGMSWDSRIFNIDKDFHLIKVISDKQVILLKQNIPFTIPGNSVLIKQTYPNIIDTIWSNGANQQYRLLRVLDSLHYILLYSDLNNMIGNPNSNFFQLLKTDNGAMNWESQYFYPACINATAYPVFNILIPIQGIMFVITASNVSSWGTRVFRYNGTKSLAPPRMFLYGEKSSKDYGTYLTDSISIKIKRIEGAIKYRIICWAIPSEDLINVNLNSDIYDYRIIDTGDSTVVISKLLMNYRYFFRCYALNSKDTSIWSELDFLTEKPDLEIPLIINPNSNKYDKTQITFLWNSVPNASCYDMNLIQYDSTDKNVLKEVCFKDTALSFDHLKLKNTYDIYIRGCNDYGKGNWSYIQFYVDNESDVLLDNNNAPVFFVSPNPTSDYIDISLLKSNANHNVVEIDHIKIYNSIGEIVMSIPTTQAMPSRIDVSILSPGLYFVRSGTQSAKFIKE